MTRAVRVLVSVLTVALFAVVFIVPFVFIALTAIKTPAESSLLQFSWPSEIALVQNFVEVLRTREYLLVIAFINSTVLTVVSVALMVILSAMTAFVWQRRPGRSGPVIQLIVLSGLIIPPAVVPTIWVLQALGMFRTMPGLILVEVVFGLSFSTLLFRAFISTIPRDLDEAAIVDGAGPLRLFFRIVFPLLRPVAVTVIVVQSVNVFNDFVNPLYFAPSLPTVQLTLYNFQSQYLTQNNLLFMNILLITIPPLITFLVFNRQMVAGMTSGAIKG